MKLPTIANSRKLVFWGCVCIAYGAAVILSSGKGDLGRFFWPALIWSVVVSRIASRLRYSRVFWIAAAIGGGVLAAVPLWEHGNLWRNKFTRILGIIAFVLFLVLAAQELQSVFDPTKEPDPNMRMGTGIIVVILAFLWLVGFGVEKLHGRLKGHLSFSWGGNWNVYPSTKRAMVGLTVIALVAIGISWWWLYPPESLTQRLWRECNDTLAYTHPEWSEQRREAETKHCMDRRLLSK